MAVRPSPGLPAHLARSPGRVPRGYTLLQMEPSEGWWHPHDPPPLSARHLRGARDSENLTHMWEVSTVLCGDLTQVSTGPVMSLRLLWGDGDGGHPRTYRGSAHRPDLVRSSLGPRTHQNTQKSGCGVSTRGRDARSMDILRVDAHGVDARPRHLSLLISPPVCGSSPLGTGWCPPLCDGQHFWGDL